MISTTRRTAALSAVAVALAGLGALTTAATATAISTAAPAATSCQVEYTVTGQWGGQYQASVAVKNLGSPVSTWTVGWTFADGQKIQQLWNGVASQTGSSATAANAPYNGSLGSGATTSFGFIGTWNDRTNTLPTSFTLNGKPCTGTTAPDQPTPTPTPKPTAQPTPEPTPTAAPTTPPSTTGGLYTDTDTQAYVAWSAASGTEKALLAKIALTPQSMWVGDWTDVAQSKADVAAYTGRAAAAGKTGTLVIYAIPGRDCGSYSGGGVATSKYATWIDTIASGIKGKPFVVLEPDALAQLGECDGQGDRAGYLKYAAQKLTEAGGRVYIDIGHSGWLPASKASTLLNQIGFQYAEGFALNTSNYQTTADSRAYGETVSAAVGGKPFVIDTSRNGNGSNGEWCNPRGRALGDKPKIVADGTHLAATLWVKIPGESDGTCNGGPAAGHWWNDIALEMARNATW